MNRSGDEQGAQQPTEPGELHQDGSPRGSAAPTSEGLQHLNVDEVEDRPIPAGEVAVVAAASSSTPEPKRRLFRRAMMRPRRFLVKVHRWVAIAFMIPLAVVVITGVLMVFRYTLDDWMHSELYQHGSGDVGVSAVLDSVSTELPDAVVNNVLAPDNNRGVYLVDVSVAGGHVDHHGESGDEATVQRHVYVDPATGEINGVRDPNAGFLFWVDRGHAAFWQEQGIFAVDAPGGYCDSPTGLAHPICTLLPDGGDIIGWIGVVWMGLVLTGFYLWYWPGVKRWARAFTVRRTRGVFTFNLDLHKSVGLLTIVPALIIAWTGAQIGFPFMQQMFSTATPAHQHLDSIIWSPPDDAWASTPVGDSPPLTADQVLAKLHDNHPTWTLESIAPPGDETGVWMVWVDSGSYTPYRREVTKGDTMALVDQYSGTENWSGNPSAGNVFDQAYAVWYWPLHTGEFLGAPTRLLWLILGLTPVVLATTGIVMNRIRARKRHRARTDHGDDPAPPRGTDAEPALLGLEG